MQVRLSFASMSSDAFPIAERGVYCQPYTIRGRREYFAVDSRGEHVAARLVREGRDPAQAIAELWDELNEFDPISPHALPPSLRVVR
jgi:hypothetical protein